MAAMERIRHELREIGLVTLYFLACFLLFLSLKKLVLEQYEVELTILGTALISALVVAKVVVLLGKTSFGNRFDSQRLIVHVVWRSLAYTAAVFVVTLAEHLFDGYREEGDLGAALDTLWAGRDADHFLAMNLAVGLSLLGYNVYAAIDRELGEGSLRRLLFSPARSSASEPAPTLLVDPPATDPAPGSSPRPTP